MFDIGKITFTQEWGDGQKIVHEIRGDSSLDEVVDAFEMFLKGAGYHLPDGKHIGYEYDEEVSEYQNAKEDYDRMQEDLTITGKHSKYYWDTDRNR